MKTRVLYKRPAQNRPTPPGSMWSSVLYHGSVDPQLFMLNPPGLGCEMQAPDKEVSCAHKSPAQNSPTRPGSM